MDSKSKYLLLLSFALLIVLASCQPDKDRATYLHIAHSRANYGKDRLIPAVTEVDFTKYDVLMLGGDLVAASTGKRATLQYLDSIFQLGQATTLWTLGNHDYDHPKWIPEITGRPKNYTFNKNGITFLVLDSQENNCNTNSGQRKLFLKTLSNLKPETTHLILLHHKLLWMLDNGALQEQVNTVSNGKAGTCFHCVQPNDFYQVLYPKLVELQKNGVQVLCIAGDIGSRVSAFEYQTTDGIYFLASGLKDGGGENKVLLFDHDLKNNKISWQFEDLDALPKIQ